VVLESTHARALDFVLIEWLRKHAVVGASDPNPLPPSRAP
jgi:hypothetical protein